MVKHVDTHNTDPTLIQADSEDKTDPSRLNSPAEPGESTRTALFSGHAGDDAAREEGAAPPASVAKPHAVSLAVWDVGSPALLETDFTIKVGAKCTLGCSLAGQPVAVADLEGTEIATGFLSAAPYSEAIDLYWAEVPLRAPASRGTYRMQVRLPQLPLEPAHEGAAFTFGFSVVGRPEHAVTLEIVNRDTRAPVANARVTLRPYGGHTDSNGLLNLAVAAGEYVLYVTKGEYDNYRAIVTVTGDTTVRAELTPARFIEDYRGNLLKVEKKTQ